MTNSSWDSCSGTMFRAVSAGSCRPGAMTMMETDVLAETLDVSVIAVLGTSTCEYHTSNDVFPRCKTCAK